MIAVMLPLVLVALMLAFVRTINRAKPQPPGRIDLKPGGKDLTHRRRKVLRWVDDDS